MKQEDFFTDLLKTFKKQQEQDAETFKTLRELLALFKKLKEDSDFLCQTYESINDAVSLQGDRIAEMERHLHQLEMRTRSMEAV